jgi:DmsE family decaheme c-type cytochrome
MKTSTRHAPLAPWSAAGGLGALTRTWRLAGALCAAFAMAAGGAAGASPAGSSPASATAPAAATVPAPHGAAPAPASGPAAAAAGPAVPIVSPNSPATLGYSAQGADTCLVCHGTDKQLMTIFRTAHARPGDPHGPFGPGGLQCEACHGPGGAHVKSFGIKPMGVVVFGSKSPTPVAKQNAMCLGCHRSSVGHAWAASAHAANDVSCADCHQIHSAADPVRTQSTEAQVCARCHQAVSAAFLSPYHHPVPEGTMTCSSCHDPHGSTARAMLVKSTVDETCTSCHAQFRGPFLWEHQPVTESCANCHTPHGSVQPALLKERPPILCQECHDAAGHPSVPYGPQGLPGMPAGMPNPFLLEGGCVNCHSRVHGSNSPSGRALMR